MLFLSALLDKEIKIHKDAFPNALTTLKPEPKSFIPNSEISKDKCKSDFVEQICESFLSEGTDYFALTWGIYYKAN